jgi:osmoprotectant transport system ATP-binding protein
MSALLTLQDVSKRFGGTTVLAQTSLSVERGLTTALIGPSGCGKSTILRLIVGLTAPDSGRITFAGREINLSNVAGLRPRIGYVIQESGLFPHLTARDNVLLMARHLKKPAAEIEPRLNELRELTQLDRSVLERYPAELSGGQRQRIGLMRALMLSPELLLLDEPLAALDPLVRYALQRDLKEIFERLQQTTLIVTHDLAEAAYLGDTIILMNAGKIVQQGTLAEFRATPASHFVTDFIKAQRPLAET